MVLSKQQNPITEAKGEMKTITTIICIGIAFVMWCCCKVGGDADREDGHDG